MDSSLVATHVRRRSSASFSMHPCQKKVSTRASHHGPRTRILYLLLDEGLHQDKRKTSGFKDSQQRYGQLVELVAGADGRHGGREAGVACEKL